MKNKKRILATSMALLLMGTLPLNAFAGDWYIDQGDITVNAGADGQTVKQGDREDSDSEPVITQKDTTTSTGNTVTINAEEKQTANVTIKDVNIDTSSTGGAAISTDGKGDVTIELDGDNTIKSGESHAGLEKNSEGELTITDSNDTDGSLDAKGGMYGAGIGGKEGGKVSDITITGGEVTATGGMGSSGIGGGYGAGGSDITISGGEVTATGGSGGAGIGSGYGAIGGDIIISGGEVTATGGSGGAGIGSATFNGNNGNIIISGGTINAKGGSNSRNDIGKGSASSDNYVSVIVGEIDGIDDTTRIGNRVNITLSENDDGSYTVASQTEGVDADSILYGDSAELPTKPGTYPITCKLTKGTQEFTVKIGEYVVEKGEDGSSDDSSSTDDSTSTDDSAEITEKTEAPSDAHWYAEWTPNGDGTHSANCKHEDCDHVGTIGCETFEVTLNGTAFNVCPVCGELENGTRLELVEDAEADGKDLPKGELVLRENGELMSVGFEYGGELTQPTEEVTITLPAEVVNGYTLTILAADGTETDLETTFDAEGETVSFTLDFGETPVVLIHMAAAA